MLGRWRLERAVDDMKRSVSMINGKDPDAKEKVSKPTLADSPINTHFNLGC
jgi:hypothetical protein